MVQLCFVEMQTHHHGNTLELKMTSRNGKIIGAASQRADFIF